MECCHGAFSQEERCHVFPFNHSSCSACDRERDAAALRKGLTQSAAS